MCFRSFRRSACLFLALAVTAACVNHAYDFDRLEHAVALGGDAMVVPLVNTGALTIEDLVGDKLDEYLLLNEDRTYSLSYDSAPFSFTFDELKDYDTSGPFRRYIDYPISYGFDLFSKPADLPFDDEGKADLAGFFPDTVALPDLSKTASLSVPRLPEELVAVNSITLSEDSHFDVTISLPDCMFTEGTLTPDFTVDMSSFFESEDARDGILHFDTPLTAENGYSVTRSYNLHKVIFDPRDFDPRTHTITLHATVNVNGTCYFSGLKTDREHFAQSGASTVLLVQVILRTVDCVAFEGAYDYTVKDVSTSVDVKGMLDEFTTIFDSRDFNLQLTDPEILLNVETNVPIPTRANLDLVARKNGLRYADIKNILIDFPYAEPGETIRHGIRLAGEAKHEEGIDDVIVDFSKLMSRVPDEIRVNATASTIKERIAEVRFGESYFMNLQPTLHVPMAFGPETRLSLSDTVAMPAELGKILKDNKVTLAGTITNTLPLEVDFSVVMLNDAGIMVTEEVTQHLAAGGTSTINIPLVNKVEDGIVRLSKAVLSFQVKGTAQPRAIKADDYLQAKIHAEVPGGYHFNF
jgi:hypothetical protein